MQNEQCRSPRHRSCADLSRQAANVCFCRRPRCARNSARARYSAKHRKQPMTLTYELEATFAGRPSNARFCMSPSVRGSPPARRRNPGSAGCRGVDSCYSALQPAIQGRHRCTRVAAGRLGRQRSSTRRRSCSASSFSSLAWSTRLTTAASSWRSRMHLASVNEEVTT